MNTKIRILSVRLLEKINRKPAYAQQIGIISKSRTINSGSKKKNFHFKEVY